MRSPNTLTSLSKVMAPLRIWLSIPCNHPPRKTEAMIDNIDSTEEGIKRLKLSALGCILYRVIPSTSILSDLGHGENKKLRFPIPCIHTPEMDHEWNWFSKTHIGIILHVIW
jgi:hypothetical protein